MMVIKEIMVVAVMCSIMIVGCSNSQSPACDTGWFGPDCMYKCRCANTDCSNMTTCTSCEPQWFGPECQYADVAYGKTVDTSITDGNDTTCMTYSRTIVTVDLKSEYPFTWLRIVVNNADFLQNVTITFWPFSNCINPRNATVDDKTLDIYCDLEKLVQYVTLEGQGIQYLCSVYISGGRNVALKQATNQSTTYSEVSIKTGWKNMSLTSEKAVDGIRSGALYKTQSCSSTGTESNGNRATWTVTFREPRKVNRYVIYYRTDGKFADRAKFTLRGFDENNTEVVNLARTRAIYKEVYTLASNKVTPALSRVTIQSDGKENILTFCEVEIYGEYNCKSGRYGLDCEHICNCRGNQTCFISTGRCPFGCADGFQGDTCNERVSESESDISDGAVGAFIGIVVAILAGVIAILLLRRWKRNHPERLLIPMDDAAMEDNKSRNEKSENIVPALANTPVAARKDHIVLPATPKQGKQPEKEPKNDEESKLYYNFVTQYSSTVVPLKDFAEFIKSKDKAFFQDQFNKIQVNQSASMSVGLSPENKHKNRYKNISAYDHSRVHLIPNINKKHGDFINASYVEGYKSDERFIASQGPTKIILEDFVRMLWEQEVEKVVMLTNLVEDGKQKCERYWPEDGEMTVGEITVKLTTTQVFADYTIRRLQLSKEDKPVQNVTHFHFTAWPDKDVPTGPWGLVDFEQRVAFFSTCKPIVVHCSAGVGRTGTFIALRNVMRQAEETGHMDFFTTVQKLRHDRINMVQTVDQYIFIHNAALIAMICIGTTVTMGDIHARILTLETKTKQGQTLMEAEFNSICSVCEDNRDEKSADDNPYNIYMDNERREKNRYNFILPKELYRAVLAREIDDVDDYINAVLVPSFSKRNQQILTQLPLRTTVVDFWRLVSQYNVTLIVAFEAELKSSDKTIGNYLPDAENGSKVFSMFQVRTEAVSSNMYWDHQKVLLTIDKDTVNNASAITSTPELKLHHLTCTSSDLSPGFLLAIIEQIRSLHSLSHGRILYTCRNGADYSGLVCVLSLLLDRMDNDQCLTVPLVVGALKAIRPQVIPTLEQYRLLYEVLQQYSENMSEYSNFGNLKS